MAGEIQLNSTTMATESSGSITAELDTIRPNTTNGSLTLQGDSSGSGVTGLTIDSSGNATFAQTISGGTIGSGVVFPAGSIMGWESVSTTPVATQGTDLTYTDLTGSSKSYTPVSGSSYVVYEYNTHLTGVDSYPLILIKFIFDGSEQSNSNEDYFFYNAGENFSTNLKFRYILNSWSGAKTMSLQYRVYSSATHEVQLHKAKYSGNATSNQVFVKIHQITYSVM